MDVLRPLFQRIRDGDLQAHASVISLSEVLVHPFALGRMDLAEQYREFLTRSPHLTMHSIDADIVEHSAALRAQYGLRTPDSIVAATSLVADCQFLATNDAAFRRVKEVTVLLVSDFLSG